MIQANELRIQNLVLKGNQLWIINIYDLVSLSGIDIPIAIYESELKVDYKPIPITEEWIKKFDVLEIRDKTWRFNNYVIEHWYNMYLIKYISMTNQLIQIGTEIKYVHQFQNIAFALTQTELELK